MRRMYLVTLLLVFFASVVKAHTKERPKSIPITYDPVGTGFLKNEFKGRLSDGDFLAAVKGLITGDVAITEKYWKRLPNFSYEDMRELFIQQMGVSNAQEACAMLDDRNRVSFETVESDIWDSYWSVLITNQNEHENATGKWDPRRATDGRPATPRLMFIDGVPLWDTWCGNLLIEKEQPRQPSLPRQPYDKFDTPITPTASLSRTMGGINVNVYNNNPVVTTTTTSTTPGWSSNGTGLVDAGYRQPMDNYQEYPRELIVRNKPNATDWINTGLNALQTYALYRNDRYGGYGGYSGRGNYRQANYRDNYSLSYNHQRYSRSYYGGGNYGGGHQQTTPIRHFNTSSLSGIVPTNGGGSLLGGRSRRR